MRFAISSRLRLREVSGEFFLGDDVLDSDAYDYAAGVGVRFIY